MVDAPRFYGIHRGVVVDPTDPTKKHRVKVKVPDVNGDGDLGWALPCFPVLVQQPKLVNMVIADGVYVSGTTEKITVRPLKRGDAVWVMFENGDATRPVWLGSWLGV